MYPSDTCTNVAWFAEVCSWGWAVSHDHGHTVCSEKGSFELMGLATSSFGTTMRGGMGT